MRKIEQAMCEAVRSRRNWQSCNTRVENFNGEITVYLHGNAIYRIIDGVHYWSFCGWPTMTTKSRLRALGVDYKKQGYEAYSWYKINKNGYDLAV